MYTSPKTQKAESKLWDVSCLASHLCSKWCCLLWQGCLCAVCIHRRECWKMMQKRQATTSLCLPWHCPTFEQPASVLRNAGIPGTSLHCQIQILRVIIKVQVTWVIIFDAFYVGWQYLTFLHVSYRHDVLCRDVWDHIGNLTGDDENQHSWLVWWIIVYIFSQC